MDRRTFLASGGTTILGTGIVATPELAEAQERDSGIRHVEVPGYPAPHSPYSHAVVANGLVFVSGQIPVKPGGGPTEVVGVTMQEQTRQSLHNIQTILKAAGSSLDRVVKITVLLARPDLYKEMNEAYAESFRGRSRRGRWPASAPTSRVCSSA
jgi:2-iminobutanoate/2-iminopropanoate deaminase